jgi:hypothetical protein
MDDMVLMASARINGLRSLQSYKTLVDQLVEIRPMTGCQLTLRKPDIAWCIISAFPRP